ASLIFLFRSSRKELILLCISGGLAYAFAKILKILMHTERPFVLFPQVTSLFLETGYAFPSGHTAVASAIAFLIYFYNKKAGYIFMLFALLIGIARIIAGVHFPVDILGGFILGALVSYLFAYFVKKI
ncbi:MAG: Phosphoesterase PA-phosphatase related protein, partial [Candidatus Nomurabacteria bacterium GW2011_GWA2_40_97]